MRPTHAAYSLVLLLLLTSCSDGSRSEEMLLAKPPIEDTVAKEEMTIQEEKLKHQVRLQAPELVPEENPFLNAKVPQVTDGKHSFTNFVLDYSDASQKKALLESIKMVVAKEDYPADGSKIYSWVYVADAIDYIYDKRTYSAYTQRVFAAVGLNNPVLSEAEDIVYLGGKSAIPCYSNKGEIEDFVMLDVPATGLSSNDSNSIVAVISAEQWGEGGGQLHPTTIYFVDVLSCKVIKKIIPGGWGRDIVFNSLAKSWPHASDELLYHFFPEEDFILAKPMPKTQAELQELSRIEYFRMKEQPDKDPKLILQELGYKKIEL